VINSFAPEFLSTLFCKIVIYAPCLKESCSFLPVNPLNLFPRRPVSTFALTNSHNNKKGAEKIERRRKKQETNGWAMAPKGAG